MGGPAASEKQNPTPIPADRPRKRQIRSWGIIKAGTAAVSQFFSLWNAPRSHEKPGHREVMVAGLSRESGRPRRDHSPPQPAWSSFDSLFRAWGCLLVINSGITPPFRHPTCIWQEPGIGPGVVPDSTSVPGEPPRQLNQKTPQ